MHNNINVNVSGPQQPASTYKTVVLKGQVPFVTQVTEPNTKYVIKHNFDLGGESVTIPEGCLLEFDGGSLENGSLVGQNTVIEAGLVKIFGTNVTISGSWNVSEAYPEWFGAVGDGVTDCTASFQKTINFGKNVFISKGNYILSDTINLYKDVVIIGEEGDDNVQLTITHSDYAFKVYVDKNYERYPSGNQNYASTSGYIKNIYIYCDISSDEAASGFYLYSCFKLYNVITRGLRVAVNREHYYIDFFVLDNCNFKQCRNTEADDFIVNLYGNTDGLVIKQCSMKSIDPNNTTRGIKLYRCHGGLITSCINTFIQALQCDALTIQNLHNESEGSMIFSYSNVVLDGYFHWKNKITNDIYVYGSDNFIGSLKMSNCDFAMLYTAGNTYGDVLPTEIAGLDNRTRLEIVNCRRYITEGNQIYSFGILTNLEVQQEAAYDCSKYFNMTQAHLHFDSFENRATNGTLVASIYSGDNMTGKTLNGTYYYRILQCPSFTRKVYTTSTPVASITVASGELVKLTTNLYGNLLVLRGTTSGVYSEYAIVPAFVGDYIIDSGSAISGFIVKSFSTPLTVADFVKIRRLTNNGTNVIIDAGAIPDKGDSQRGDICIVGTGDKTILNYYTTKWVESGGAASGVKNTGTKAQRPLGNDIYVGFQYMQVDTTYGTYPIWASAISGSTVTWVKADGTDPDA